MVDAPGRTIAILCGGAGAVLHLGTALLRLDSFWPFPRLLDFSTLYAAAWAIGRGESPYPLSPELVADLIETAGLPGPPPSAYSSPILFIFLLPFTWFRYPVAAWLYLFLSLGLLAWASRELARIADLPPGRTVMVFPLVVTFGPVFLDLTLGQVSTLLLVLVLLAGRHLRRAEGRDQVVAGIACALATAVKLFPLSWLGAPIALRRFRSASVAAVLLVVGLGATAVTRPGLVSDWLHRLEQRVAGANARPAIDDQSLVAWLDRMGRSQRFNVPGLSVADRETVTWTHPWEVDPLLLRSVGYGAASALTLAILWALWRRGERDPEGGLYLFVLATLVLFPHIARYNHALLLPAMAAVWGAKLRFRAELVGIAYLLAGLARLTHLWARILPVPWAPILTGSGLLAVLLLMAGMARRVGFLDTPSAEAA